MRRITALDILTEDFGAIADYIGFDAPSCTIQEFTQRVLRYMMPKNERIKELEEEIKELKEELQYREGQLPTTLKGRSL